MEEQNVYTLTRETYKRLKSFNRVQMQEFISEVYRGAEENAASVVDDVDFEELRSRIGEVKGVGEARLNDIMDVIKEYFGS